MRILSSGAVIWNWRHFFTRSNLDNGQHDAESGGIPYFECDPDGRWARGETRNGFEVEVKSAPTTVAEYLNYPDWSILANNRFSDAPNAFHNYYLCTCSQGSNGMRCRHLAGLMLLWEQRHGPFVMRETPEERALRLERERLELEKARKQKQVFPVLDYVRARVKPAPGNLRFPPDAILRRAELLTDQYEAEKADKLGTSVTAECFDIDFDGDGNQLLTADYDVDDHRVHFAVSHDNIVGLKCTCGQSRTRPVYSWYASNQQGRMCAHALAAWLQFRSRIIRERPGDATDLNGMRFLSLLTSGAARANGPDGDAAGNARRQCVTLVPRIFHDRYDELRLGFDVGLDGGRQYAVKSLESLSKAVESRGIFNISKTNHIDFSEAAFTEASEAWYRLMQTRINDIARVNVRLKNSYYGSVKLPVGAGIPLEGSALDRIYDMTEGGELTYQYGGRNGVCRVRVGEAQATAELHLEPVKRGEKLEGVRVIGIAPRLLKGSEHQYVLDRSCFGRVTDQGLSLLGALRAIDDRDEFQCVIGDQKLAEFYYRALPALQNSRQIRLTDNVGDAIEALVPPEPDFTFYIDLDDRLTCRTVVAYGEQVFELGRKPDDLSRRDRDQEARVTAAIREYFPEDDDASGLPCCAADEDHLIRVLTRGVASLSRYGEVKGSDAFKRMRIRTVSQPRFTVRLEGGLIDLSIKTRDLSEDELLELLAGYRLKKRWHRLKSGDFIDLGNSPALQALEEAALALDISVEALIRGGASAPAYRALYVDRLLEAHDDITASRDQRFKALVRAFQTIRDSDFEAPDALSDVLRPYQLYGFRWMSTLAQAGFGGILADEMGLGKTLQALAFIRSRRLTGEDKPALVVCPASLVYNWREECRKFTPELSIGLIEGPLSKRKAMLENLTQDLYVTSYDLLKRDITLYDGARFSTILLDEAQYIKNRRAAVSKAVRVLRADHRFALTGTPIENRLSELWSIFDFLMPGFLYSADEFAARFEGPIMKQKDQAATAKLARMTEPFILRRRKSDVLKDLPEKLEETRSAEMQPEQRRLYDAQLVRMKGLLQTSGDSGEDKLRILAELTRLRQLCCDPALVLDDYSGGSAKRLACLELIQSAMDAGHRMLVFSQFTGMLGLLEDDLRAAKIPFYTLTGATPKRERMRLVNAFNDGDVPVFLISLRAGGTGLNLTGADVVIHYDPWWNLAVQNQATDRTHRIGQEKTVTVVKLIAADSIEERIVALQESKRDLAEAIISGQNTSLLSLSREELMALLG